MLPQRLSYQADNDEGAEAFRFSFVSVDRSTPTHQLVVGEYATGAQTRRLLTLALDGGDPHAPLALTDGVAVPTGVEDGVASTQGALDGRRTSLCVGGPWCALARQHVDLAAGREPV